MSTPNPRQMAAIIEDWAGWEGRWELIQGVPEYLIVNPGEQAALQLRLVNGRYEDAASVAWGAAMALLGGRLSVTIATGE